MVVAGWVAIVLPSVRARQSTQRFKLECKACMAGANARARASMRACARAAQRVWPSVCLSACLRYLAHPREDQGWRPGQVQRRKLGLPEQEEPPHARKRQLNEVK